jgi:hypothetical protein
MSKLASALISANYREWWGIVMHKTTVVYVDKYQVEFVYYRDTDDTVVHATNLECGRRMTNLLTFMETSSSNPCVKVAEGLGINLLEKILLAFRKEVYK